MASENVKDWDLPLPSEPPTEEEEEGEEEEEMKEEARRQKEMGKKLKKYVCHMAYRPGRPHRVKPLYQVLSVPKDSYFVGVYEDYGEFLDPRGRKERMKRLSGKYRGITTEQFEEIVKIQNTKQRKKEDLVKEKHEIYHSLVTKLETQFRTQYLRTLVKKFSRFLSHLALDLTIPASLIQPYDRMQRAIFCNLLMCIGITPDSYYSMYYDHQEAEEYEVCHKLAHAILCLMIKALDAASAMDPNKIPPLEHDFMLDNYIKERLMCAARKKVRHLHKKKPIPEKHVDVYSKCHDF